LTISCENVIFQQPTILSSIPIETKNYCNLKVIYKLELQYVPDYQKKKVKKEIIEIWPQIISAMLLRGPEIVAKEVPVLYHAFV